MCTCRIIKEYGVKSLATIHFHLFAMMVRNLSFLKVFRTIYLRFHDISHLYIYISPTGRANASTSYVLVNQYRNWTDAQSYCREYHTDLVSIRNETEIFELQTLFPYYYFWIGLYRSRSWSDQSNSSFSNWRTGQPDNAGNTEYCTAVSFRDSGSWTDENCNTALSFMCYSGEYFVHTPTESDHSTLI